MNHNALLPLILAMSASSIAVAQPSGMKDMDMQHCMGMKGMKSSEMKNMDMSKMDMQMCMDMMQSKDKRAPVKAAQGKTTHKAVAVVKAVDSAKSNVTLAHGPVKSLKWPAMTMSFVVKDKQLFDKLVVDKKVDIELVKEGSDYVVIAVK